MSSPRYDLSQHILFVPLLHVADVHTQYTSWLHRRRREISPVPKLLCLIWQLGLLRSFEQLRLGLSESNLTPLFFVTYE
jgi:hypothetical protein